MDLYKTAISVLLVAPIAGGIGLHLLHNYQTLQEKAEDLAVYSENTMKEVESLLEDGSDETLLLPDENLSSDIADEVIRFHVRANSDSEEDQALKLLVRDAILEELEPELSAAESKEEARNIMKQDLGRIEEIGKEVIQDAGYDYEINAYLTEEEFPVKSYGDLMFPAGEYEALRVDIGEREGGNWWCVMYPGLCFVETAGGVVATEGKEELQRVLTPEEYEEILICPSEDTEVEYDFLLWESWKNILDENGI